MQSKNNKQSQTLSITNEQLLQRILNGEKELFELLMERNNQQLYRVIRSYVKEEESAHDVMQNTYIKAYTHLAQFHQDASFTTWLIRIGINEALHYIKSSKKNINSVSVETDEAENKLPEVEIETTTPEKTTIQHETFAFIEHAINNLPEKYRAVFMLREIEGLSSEETAACLELTESNVKVRLFRAKNLLRAELHNLTSEFMVYPLAEHHCRNVRSVVMDKISMVK
ncbi:MAG: hypothetical protein BGO32_00325 [Bacteroidetes bacterium 37-13]|nr:MAG: hypothetical protein BGO32_00325 [Bacteroidetes bacterium 37-13]